jgi:hypothetical protein
MLLGSTVQGAAGGAAQPTSGGVRQGTEIAQRNARLERVIEVPALIEDATLARARQEILGQQDLVPVLLHRPRLREEATSAESNRQSPRSTVLEMPPT